MSRKYNFCAGPASLPESVLQQAAAELVDYQGAGLSIMEMSHRSSEIVGIADGDITKIILMTHKGRVNNGELEAAIH